MSELLGLSTSSETSTASNAAQAMPSTAGMHAKLVKADFHGSIMTGVHQIMSNGHHNLRLIYQKQYDEAKIHVS
jgi:hypothetical protein